MRHVLLEPLDEVAIRIPDEHLGAVLGDLSGRRGRVLGTEVGGPGRTVVRAEVPCTELLRYAVDLRAMTSGAATFTRHFARYEEPPKAVLAETAATPLFPRTALGRPPRPPCAPSPRTRGRGRGAGRTSTRGPRCRPG